MSIEHTMEQWNRLKGAISYTSIIFLWHFVNRCKSKKPKLTNRYSDFVLASFAQLRACSVKLK